MGGGRRSWVLVVGGCGLIVAVVAEDGGSGSFMVVGVLVACVHWGQGCWYMGIPRLVRLCRCPVVVVVVRLSWSLSGCLPHRWQRGGTWEARSQGEGAVESTVGMFTHLWPKTARR